MMNESRIDGSIMEGETKEECHAFEIFPEEIWEEIFKRVMEPLDWLNLYQASSSFHSVMKGKRIDSLFPVVIAQLATTSHLPAKDVLQCRFICKNWKSAVDNFYEDELNKMKIWQHSKYPYRRRHYYFTSGLKIQHFLHSMESYFGNPFSKQRVSLHVTCFLGGFEELEANRFWTKVLLEQFGLQLNFLRLAVSCLDFDNDESVRMMLWLGDYLRLVPNVKVLLLSYGATKRTDQVKSYLENNPLPLLSNVEQVQINCTTGVCSLSQLILKMCCHPEKLKQLSIYDIPEYTSFPNLEVLQTSLHEDNRKILLKSEWQLQGLYLHFSDYNFTETCLAIMRFKETLSTLVLNTQVNVVELGNNFKLELPNLKHFKIYSLDGTLDFLEGLISLEEVNIENYTRKVAYGEIIKVENNGTMLNSKSNVWKVLKKLRTFRLGQEIFLRDNQL